MQHSCRHTFRDERIIFSPFLFSENFMSGQTSSALENWLQVIESFHPKEIDLGLDRIQSVANALNCTKFECPVISVAGTNGKGSTVESLKQLALVKGLNVGTYTSPHLFEFNERIAINDAFVSDHALINAFEQIEKVRTQNPNNIIPLSFFEFTTLAALLIFKASALDLIVLEVGLGGRLDAVNIVDANIAIITSIGIDHEAWLGNSRELIAIEKAGIARKNRICIIGDKNPPANLHDHLLNLGAQCLQVEQDFSFVKKNNTLEFFLAGFKTGATHLNNPSILLSTNNIKLAPENILLALQAFACLKWQVSEAEAQQALSQTTLLGRFQVFDLNEKGTPAKGKIICDLTHNPAGAEFFLKQLQAYFETYKPASISILFGVMADKDIAGIIKVFSALCDSWLLCNMSSERAAKASEIQAILHSQQNNNHTVKHHATSQTFDSINLGLEHYLQNAQTNDCLLVMGSFFSVAPVIKTLSK